MLCCPLFGGFRTYRFRSIIFEGSHPLAATINTGVVTRVVDEERHVIKYYRIIKNIIEYNFVGNKKLKIVFSNCDWFDPNRGT
jgi:PII-like signaling protein